MSSWHGRQALDPRYFTPGCVLRNPDTARVARVVRIRHFAGSQAAGQPKKVASTVHRATVVLQLVNPHKGGPPSLGARFAFNEMSVRKLHKISRWQAGGGLSPGLPLIPRPGLLPR